MENNKEMNYNNDEEKPWNEQPKENNENTVTRRIL